MLPQTKNLNLWRFNRVLAVLFSAFALLLSVIGGSACFASNYLSSANSTSSNKNTLVDKLKQIPVDQIKEKGEPVEDGDQTKKPITVYEDETEEDSIDSGIAKIYLTIAVPHTKKPVARVEAFPYPPKPPQSTGFGDLTEKDEEIKKRLIDNGYISRVSADYPFPPGGWRFQYALRKARKASKMSVPHSIVEHYKWSEKMVPFLKSEIIKINQFEKARREKYSKYVEFYNDNGSQLSNKAIRQNVNPVKFVRLPKESKKIGMNFGGILKPGKWWIYAEYKVTGLTYYWIQEIDLNDKDQIVMVFNEGNASLVNGLW